MSDGNSDKQTIEVDLTEIRKTVNQFFQEKATKILESSIDFEKLKNDSTMLLKGGVFKSPKIIEVISDACEWSLSSAVREAIEQQEFKAHVAQMVVDLMADPEFNESLKANLRESLLKRV